MLLLTERPALENVLDFVVQGNTAQMNDKAFVEELKAWIRFNGADAVRLGDGLFSKSSGNPETPAWLGSLMFGLFFTPKAENEKYVKHLRTSAGVAVFAGAKEDKAHWGRPQLRAVRAAGHGAGHSHRARQHAGGGGRAAAEVRRSDRPGAYPAGLGGPVRSWAHTAAIVAPARGDRAGLRHDGDPTSHRADTSCALASRSCWSRTR
jgi:hypothetical protein